MILFDIIFPGNTDGRRLTEKLAARLPNVKTIFMSGFTESSIIHNGNIDEGIVFLQNTFQDQRSGAGTGRSNACQNRS
ncbi:hypothetical protein IMCC3135_09005 [Granulosicoccus antarcticus IMCC3135]|uniref:Response regulatory domain-containing protein n=1 Tax=Granulosicoccus antarcticus IMCC3135 TaxID=1192854 RepID=A0A2Z2NQG1_9GAMM|nr:hypothetical protein IMCC3135_09005 [Granulosicoccus antarcticus IMCC3135]